MTTPSNCSDNKRGRTQSYARRDFLKLAGLVTAGTALPILPAIAGPFTAEDFQKLIPADKKLSAAWLRSLTERGEPTVYRGAELETIGMPVGASARASFTSEATGGFGIGISSTRPTPGSPGKAMGITMPSP